jgi:hypothetical protein
MTSDKIDPSKKDATISSADDLTKTTKAGDVELSEEELKRVSGGFKVVLTETPISSNSLGSSGQS